MYEAFISSSPITFHRIHLPLQSHSNAHRHRSLPPQRCFVRSITCNVSESLNTSSKTNPSSSSDSYSIWSQVKVAVPLSRVFSDHLGENSLHHLSAHKYKVVCPFHNDKNPSLHIDDDLGLFHCFGCSAKGSVIDFEQLTAGHRSVSMALRSLASKYPPISSILHNSSIHLSSNPTSQIDIDNNINIQNSDKNVRISRRVHLAQIAITRDVLQQALPIFTKAFWDMNTSEGMLYLRNERRISTPTLRAFSCGFAPSHPTRSFILEKLKKEGHTPEDIVLSGLVRTSEYQQSNSEQNDNSVRHYDLFHERVLFPIRDKEGQVLSFAGRTLPTSSTSKSSKYLNGPDSPIFSKRDLLFGVDLAVTAPSATVEDGFVIVVEGYLDVLVIFDRTQGRVACVATMGTAATVKQLQKSYELLADPADGKVIINFDSDDAGVKSVERLCDSVFPKLVDCAHAFYIAFPPQPAKDADEFMVCGGEGDTYVEMLLANAVPWYQWRGDRIVQAEIERIDKLEEQEKLEQGNDTNGRNLNGMNKRNSEREWIENTEQRMRDERDNEGNFEAILSEFIRAQSDDFVVAFGANPGEIKPTAKRKERPKCSEEVLDQLAEIIATSNRCLPGLNVPALAQAWVDSLSYSSISRMIPMQQKLISLTEQKSKRWEHLSMQTQMYWLPPPPWLLDELPGWKRKSLGYGLESIDPIADSDDDGGNGDDGYSLLDDTKYMKRSIERLKYQEEHVLPYLKARQSGQVKRLKEAPRRSAEEILLRTLIFSNEADRLDGLQALLDVIIRCGENKMPFWTCGKRESLFEYLVSVEGPMGYEEMAAYLEEYEWFTEEIEELFMPIEEEMDLEWKEIKMLEMTKPIQVVSSVAESVETMAKIVAKRKALDTTEEILGTILKKKRAMQIQEEIHDIDRNDKKEGEDGKTLDDLQKQLQMELELLKERQMKLNSEIDGSKFLRPDEMEEQQNEMEEMKLNAELERHQEEFWKEIRETEGEVQPPAWLPGGAADSGKET